MTIEKSADLLDMASQLQDQANTQALENIRRSDKPQKHPDFDGVHCLDCEVPMPPERLAAQRIRCTDCESKIEALRNRFGR